MYHYDLNMALEELTESTCVTWSCAQAQPDKSLNWICYSS